MKIFVWILESRIIGPLVVYILKKDNLIHKVFESFLSLVRMTCLELFALVVPCSLSLHFLRD